MQRRYFCLGDVVIFHAKNVNDGSPMQLEGRVAAIDEYYAYDLNRRDNGVRIVVENLPATVEVVIGEDDENLVHKDPAIVEQQHRGPRHKGEVVSALAHLHKG